MDNNMMATHPFDLFQEGQDEYEARAPAEWDADKKRKLSKFQKQSSPDCCQREGGAKDHSPLILRDPLQQKEDVGEDNTSDHLENEEEGEGGSDEDDGKGEKVKKGGHHFPQAGLLRPLQVIFRLKSNHPLPGHVFHIKFHRK